jgi:hypothetical protein
LPGHLGTSKEANNPENETESCKKFSPLATSPLYFDLNSRSCAAPFFMTLFSKCQLEFAHCPFPSHQSLRKSLHQKKKKITLNVEQLQKSRRAKKKANVFFFRKIERLYHFVFQLVYM